LLLRAYPQARTNHFSNPIEAQQIAAVYFSPAGPGSCPV